ncbi:MAG: LPXTG cell wall anchor domain-containing protein, partial [Anaerolineales bacterium]
NAASVKIPRGAFLTPIATPQQAEVPKGSGGNGWIVLIGGLLLFSALLFVLKKSRNTTTI